MWEPIDKFIKHFCIHAIIAMAYTSLFLFILIKICAANSYLWIVIPWSLLICLTIEIFQYFKYDNMELRFLDRFHDVLGYLAGTALVYFACVYGWI